MRGRLQSVVLFVACLIALLPLYGQNAVIRTSAVPNRAITIVTPVGETAATWARIDRSPDLLIVIARDTLKADDYSAMRRVIANLYDSLHANVAVRIAELRSGTPPNPAGPFRSRAQLETALRKITPDDNPTPAPNVAAFITLLGEGLDANPPAWGSTLVLGRIPAFSADVSPEVSQYAAAWLSRKAIAEKRSLMFRDLSGSPPALWAILAAQATGGGALPIEDDPGAVAAALSWETRGPSRGFSLQMVSITGFEDHPGLSLPFIASQGPLPPIAEYAELAGLLATLDTNPANLDRALAINPSDQKAVAFGLNLARRNGDAGKEIALLDIGVGLTPKDAALWTRLGDLHYSRRNFALAEPALLRARELGAKSAYSAEQLGRIRYSQRDLSGAAAFIDESLTLDGSQQTLWFFAADLARDLARASRRTEALERGLAPGGNHLDRRIELIRIYLAAGDRTNAARHADLASPSLPSDADTQTIWAHFYEDLARPDDALACWRRVIAADPKRENAHYAVSALLFDRQKYSDALEAAGKGLEADSASARLELVKVNSLEHLDRIYELRHSLEEFTPESTDIGLLRRRAEIADAFGGQASTAWRKYAEALLKDPPARADLEKAMARGWRVSLREGDLTAAAWFDRQIRKPLKEDALPAAAQLNKGFWLPGGFDALAFVAHAQAGAKAGGFLVEYSRTVIAHMTSGSPKDREVYQKEISAYFDQLKQLAALATQTGNRAAITLSLENKQTISRTETVLGMFGWKLRQSKQGIAIESGVKSGDADKQVLSAALGVDQGAMQTAFQAGRSFRFEIPFEWTPVLFDNDTWRIAQTGVYGGLAEAISQHPEVARVYLGLSNVDQATAKILTYEIGLQVLLGKYAELLALYSPALAMSGGRVMVPGGAAAEPIWTMLCNASPADPVRFYRALFEKDSGRMLAWFFALSQLDTAHQRFFTRNQKRTAEFYQAFTASADLRTGPTRMMRDGSFTQFLREIPLDGESVDFPGASEVWLIAQGGSPANRHTDKLLKKVRQAAAPEREDEVLLRLARTKSRTGSEDFSELDNFLAVARIDEHRRKGPRGDDAALDDESALILAQNYNEFSTIYPYFTVFLDLNSTDFKTLFEFLGKLRASDDLDAELILDEFNALTEMTRLALEFGGVAEARANQIFRNLCQRFVTAPDMAGITSAALDTVRDLTEGSKEDPDRALRTTLLGAGSPLDFEWNGATVSLDSARQRERAYERVLNLQKAPSVALLLRIDETLRQLGTGKIPALEAIGKLEKDVAALPSIDVPKTLKFEGHAKTSLLRSLPEQMPRLTAELRQKASKKKVNPEDIRKLCHELLAELGPQTKIALVSSIYAVYLRPENILIADDPLLTRKHQAFELRAAAYKKKRFIHSALNPDSAGEGSFFTGGFAQFALEAARAGTPESASAAVLTNQIAAIRTTPWMKYLDEDQRMLGLRLRLAREWCVYAADDPALLRDLAEDTLGVLSLNRRRALLNGIAGGDWESVWASVTVSDLLFLADRYSGRYPKSPWNSPVDAALRQVASLTSGRSLRSLGALPAALYGCNHPDRVLLAPYEEYERHLFPGDMAERTAEMKLYLAAALDRNALPAALMPSIAEPLAKLAFSTMRMSDSKDWNSVMNAFSAIDEKMIAKTLGMAVEGAK